MRGVFRFRGRSRDGHDNSKIILTDRQHELLAAESSLLSRLAAALDTFPATDDDQQAIRRAADQLGELFLLVIVGEFNAGKSAFINALIGDDVMPEGVTPTTSVINLLRFGDDVTETMLPDGIIQRTFPADFLEEITVVDTPGTNAIIREHEALTQSFVPRSDLVLFVTSADRPFTESEREFMAQIREWGKKIVIILNKIDLLRDDASREQVVTFVRDSIQRLLGFTPEVFPVSALLAQQAKALGDRNPEERDRLWDASRFDALERYVVDTLDEEGRIRLKLLNPLGIAEHISERYLQAANDRLAVLADDLTTIDNIDRQLTLYRDDMRRQFAYHLTRVENIIHRMNARGDEFFEETIRFGRIFDLLNSDKIRREFEQKVVGDTEKAIDTSIDELIDWMVEQDLRVWEAVNEYIDRRRLNKYADELIGEVGGQFRYDRRAMLESVSRRAQEEVDRYDADAHAHELSMSVRNAVATVAIAEAGAVGLGALVVAAASTAAVDITGILAASVIAGIGLFVLPAKRRRAREDFHKRSAELEQRLMAVMREQFEHELNRSVTRIVDAIAPYTRFVRSSQERFEGLKRDLTGIADDLRTLRHRIGGDADRPTQIPEPPANGPIPALEATSGEILDADIRDPNTR
ncbi:MAG TPA: dynamin family protein [Thermomicrobiales bacterium]|nr:dynamin family protein [Thermomicrobiales bacterium]